MLADEPFVKALRSFKTCVLVNNNICRKLFSSFESPTTFNEIFKVASVSFFITDCNLLVCKLDNGTFIWSVILSHSMLNQKIKLEYFYSS